MSGKSSIRTVFGRKAPRLSPIFTHGLACGRAENQEPAILVPCRNGATLLTPSHSRWFALPAEDDVTASVALAPNSNSVFVSGRSGFAVINWIAESARKPRTWRPLENAVVAHAEFDASGGLLAVGPSAGNVRVYDVDAMHVTHEFSLKRATLTTVLTFHPSPDEMLLYAGTEDGSVHCFDLASHSKKPRYVIKPHVSAVISLAFADSGRWLVVASNDRTLSISKTHTGEIIRLISVDEELAGVVCINSLSKCIVTAGEHGLLRVWNLEDGAEAKSKRFPIPLITKTHFRTKNDDIWVSESNGDELDDGEVQNAVTCMVPCSPTKVAVTLTDHSIVLLNVDDNATIRRHHVMFGDLEQINDIRAFSVRSPETNCIEENTSSNSGQTEHGRPELVVASNSNVIWVVRPPRIPANSSSEPEALDLENRVAHIQPRQSRNETWSKFVEEEMSDEIDDWSCAGVLDAHRGIVLALDIISTSTNRKNTASPSNVYVASGSRDKTARIWRRDALGEWLCLGVADGHTDAVTAVSLSPNFNRESAFVVTAANDRTLKRWNLRAIFDDTSGTNSIREDSKSNDDSYSLLRKQKEKPLMAKWTVLAHDKDINSAAISPDCQVIATGSQDKTVKLWVAETGEMKALCRGHSRGIFDVCFSPTDRVVASSSGDATIRIWNANSGACLRTIQGHNAGVLKSLFITHGTQLVSSSMDGLLKIWSVRGGECEATLDGHNESVWALASYGDGELLLSGGMDGLLQVWSDETKMKAHEMAVRKDHEALLTQRVNDAARSRKWTLAVDIALELSMPRKLKATLSQLVTSSENSEAELVKMIRELRSKPDANEKITRLLKYSRDWNSTGGASSAALAVRVLQAIFTVCTPGQLCEIVSVDKRSLVEALVAHTTRHQARICDLEARSHFLDYTLEAMRALPEMSTESTVELKTTYIRDRRNDAESAVVKRRKKGYEGHVSEY